LKRAATSRGMVVPLATQHITLKKEDESDGMRDKGGGGRVGAA
jgi:hypothetical protein